MLLREALSAFLTMTQNTDQDKAAVSGEEVVDTSRFVGNRKNKLVMKANNSIVLDCGLGKEP